MIPTPQQLKLRSVDNVRKFANKKNMRARVLARIKMEFERHEQCILDVKEIEMAQELGCWEDIEQDLKRSNWKLIPLEDSEAEPGFQTLAILITG